MLTVNLYIRHTHFFEGEEASWLSLRSVRELGGEIGVPLLGEDIRFTSCCVCVRVSISSDIILDDVSEVRIK